jgi:dephospho-CoA kinase
MTSSRATAAPTTRSEPGAAPAPPVRLLGLTGGIGAGKSEALAALGRLGAATLSSDAVVHELLGTPEVANLVTERLGAEVATGGAIDRAALAERVFADPEARGWLEGVLWPRVEARVRAWREELESAPVSPRAGVVEVPLLFEAGMEGLFDATLAVVSDRAVERAASRGHAGVAARAARQLPPEEKAARADYIVRNDGDLRDLERTLSRLLARMGA